MRTVNEIACEIEKCWPKVSPHARPYLDAMKQIRNGYYFLDSQREIVLYFLSNAQGWRGPDARRLKAELKQL